MNSLNNWPILQSFIPYRNDYNDELQAIIGFFVKDNGPDVIRTRDPRHVKAVS